MRRFVSIIGKGMTRGRKITLLIFAAVLVVSINTYFCIGYIQNYRRFGRLTNPFREMDKIPDRGTPIVDAIEKYKREVGLYPQYLEDLVPVYLNKRPAEWKYDWNYEDYWLGLDNLWGGNSVGYYSHNKRTTGDGWWYSYIHPFYASFIPEKLMKRTVPKMFENLKRQLWLSLKTFGREWRLHLLITGSVMMRRR